MPDPDGRLQDPADRWNAYWKERQEAQNKLEAEFWTDFYAHFGLPKDHPFVAQMVSEAYERGHSGGYGEVVNYFLSLLPLWEIALKCGMRKEVGGG
jgi:hypothetical protein